MVLWSSNSPARAPETSWAEGVAEQLGLVEEMAAAAMSGSMIVVLSCLVGVTPRAETKISIAASVA